MSVIKIKNAPAIESEPSSFLTADVASGSSTITVKNILGFAVNQVLLIGEPGREGSEIIKTHASSAPSGTTITLASNTVKTHYTGDKIYLMLYDQVEFSTATTAGGSKSVLTTTALWPDSPTTEYNDTASSTGYYFARFKNTISTTYSSYSDAMPVAGWASNTVGYAVKRALADVKEQLSSTLTISDCYEWINECLRLVQGKLKRWPEHYSYNAVLGQVSLGTHLVAMPTDAYDTETNKSLIGFRIGTGRDLVYRSPVAFDRMLFNVASTQVTTQASANDTTLEIDNSYDFDDSGSVDVFVSGTKYTITYTGVTRSATAGILTGVPASGTGSISVTIPVDTYVWQNQTEGTPEVFTVRNSNIEFYPLADSNNDNANAYGDYSKVATSVDSDGDTIDLQRYDMTQAYLTWRIKMKAKNNGDLDMNDGYYLSFKERMNDAIRTLPQNNVFPIRPYINRMSKRSIPRRADLQDLSISDQ